MINDCVSALTQGRWWCWHKFWNNCLTFLRLSEESLLRRLMVSLTLFTSLRSHRNSQKYVFLSFWLSWSCKFCAALLEDDLLIPSLSRCPTSFCSCVGKQQGIATLSVICLCCWQYSHYCQWERLLWQTGAGVWFGSGLGECLSRGPGSFSMCSLANAGEAYHSEWPH